MKITKLVTRESGEKRHRESNLWNILLLLQQRNRMSFSHWAERKRIPMSKFYCTTLPSTGCSLTGTLLEAPAVPTASLPGLSSSRVYLSPQLHSPSSYEKTRVLILLRVAWLLTHLPPDSPETPNQGLAGLLPFPCLLPLPPIAPHPS